MKKRHIILITGAVIGIAAGVFYFSSGVKASAMPGSVPVQEVQYQFDKGKGLVNIQAEDVFLGVGMITGVQLSDGSVPKDGFTGSISFEMINSKPGIQVQIEGIRFVEKTPAGEEGRVFEPYQVYERTGTKDRAPRLKFLKSREYFPVLWESGRNGFACFKFLDLPADLGEGELTITFQAKFPDKKRPVYYESHLPVKRKAYPRNL